MSASFKKQLIDDFNKALDELNSIEAIADFLEGKKVPKFDNAYKLILKSRLKEKSYLLEFFREIRYYDTQKMLYASISKDKPLVVKDIKKKVVAQLVPIDDQEEVVIVPNQQVSLRIEGWPKGIIRFKMLDNGAIIHSEFDDEALKNSLEHFNVLLLGELIDLVKRSIKYELSMKELYVKEISKGFLSCYNFKYEIEAIWLDSLDFFRIKLFDLKLSHFNAVPQLKALNVPKEIQDIFDKLMEVANVELVQKSGNS